jgi:hypothetical protein
MNASRFDDLTRALAHSTSRRSFLAALAAAAAGLLTARAPDDALAKKEKPPKPPKGRAEGESCTAKKPCAAELCCSAAGVCVRLGTDEHCSGCDDNCASDGRRCCSGTCTDVLHDSLNCGSCGNVCDSSVPEDCELGVCVCPGERCGEACCDAFEVCLDPATQRCCPEDNACDSACCADDERCVDGSAGRICCPVDEVCGAECCLAGCCDRSGAVPVCRGGEDDRFCGQFGETCHDCAARGETCVEGLCQSSACACDPACPVGFTCCCCFDESDGVCVNLDTGRDASGNVAHHCGACGTECAIGAQCVSGQCLCGGNGVACVTSEACAFPDRCCVSSDICTGEPGACGG